MRLQRSIGGLAAAAGSILAWGGPTGANDPPRRQESSLSIVSFGPARPYAIGTETVVLVASVRNDGPVSVPGQTVTVRVHALAGLEYLQGETAVPVPPLEPGETAAFRWKLKPASEDEPLVASLSLLQPGRDPVVRVEAIQHLPSPPRTERSSPPELPTARTAGGEAVIENNRIRIRIARSASETPFALLSCWTGNGWKRVGTVLPLAEAFSAEGGQEPWWELLRAERFEVSHTEDAARLSMVGGIGLRWRATMTLTLRANSAVAEVGLNLAALRPMRLHALRLGKLHAEAPFAAPSADELGPETIGNRVVAAVRSSGVTTGTLLPAKPPQPGWALRWLSAPPGADYRLLAPEAISREQPLALATGASTNWQGRWFTINPSQTIQDARLVALPPPAFQGGTKGERSEKPARSAHSNIRRAVGRSVRATSSGVRRSAERSVRNSNKRVRFSKAGTKKGGGRELRFAQRTSKRR